MALRFQPTLYSSSTDVTLTDIISRIHVDNTCGCRNGLPLARLWAIFWWDTIFPSCRKGEVTHLNDGVVWVDLEGLLGGHVGADGAVAQGLCLHDALHVGAPPVLAGHQHTRRVDDAV